MKASSSKYDQISINHQEITAILEDQREKLISEIHYLHSLMISCKLGMDICVEKNNMRIAIMIMLKQTYLASRMKSVQFLIKLNDDSVYSSGVKLTRKLQVAKQMTNFIYKKRQILDEDNIADFLASDPEFVQAVSIEINLRNMDKIEAEEQVLRIFQEKKIYPNNVKRRKYAKRTNISLKETNKNSDS